MLGVLASRSRSRPVRTGHTRHVKYTPQACFLPSETLHMPLKHDQEDTSSHRFDRTYSILAFDLFIATPPFDLVSTLRPSEPLIALRYDLLFYHNTILISRSTSTSIWATPTPSIASTPQRNQRQSSLDIFRIFLPATKL